MNSDKIEYIASVKRWRKNDLDKILDYMVSEGTGLTRPQALAYFEKLMQTFEFFIEQDGGFTTPLFSVQTTITGVFHDKSDKFDPQRHKINIRFKSGNRANKLIKKIKLKKELRDKLTPDPLLFVDIASDSDNDKATPGGLATLRGQKLMFNPKDSEQGVFFVDMDNSESKFRVNSYTGIKGNEIHFIVPQLPAGNYDVVVCAIMRNHKFVRAGQLRSCITVLDTLQPYLLNL